MVSLFPGEAGIEYVDILLFLKGWLTFQQMQLYVFRVNQLFANM